MTATLRRRRCPRTRCWSSAPTARPGRCAPARSSTRTASARSGVGDRRGGLRRLRHQRAPSRLRRLPGRCEGQGGPGARSRTRRARPEQPVRRRGHLGAVDRVAQGAGGAGDTAPSRCCSSATSTIIPAPRTSRRRRAATGPRSRRTSSATRSPPGPTASTFRSRRSRRRPPTSLIAAQRQDARGAGAGVRNGARLAPLPLAREPRHGAHRGRPAHRPGSQRGGAARGQRSAAQERMGHRLRALRPQRRRRDADLQRRGRQRLRRGRADRDRRGLRARRERGPPAEAQHPVRVVELGGARSARRVGLHRAAARAAEHHRGGAEHGHDRPQRGDSDRRRRAVRRARGADRRVEQQRAEPDGVLEGAGHHRRWSSSANGGDRPRA